MRNRAGMTLAEVVVALAITGLMVAGIVRGYIYCSTNTAKDALYMAANARVMERLEAIRSAQWDPSSYPAIDQLVATNFPDVVITLEKLKGSATVTATLKTDISLISSNPPLKRIRVDCIWQFQGADWVTNTTETCRSPD